MVMVDVKSGQPNELDFGNHLMTCSRHISIELWLTQKREKANATSCHREHGSKLALP